MPTAPDHSSADSPSQEDRLNTTLASLGTEVTRLKARTTRVNDVQQREFASKVTRLLESLYDEFLRPGANRRIPFDWYELNPLLSSARSVDPLAEPSIFLRSCLDLVSHLVATTEAALTKLETVPFEVNDQTEPYLDRLGDYISACRTLESELNSARLSLAAGTAETTVAHIQESAGASGTLGLGQHFLLFAQREEKRAFNLRALGVALILASVMVSALVLLNHKGESVDIQETLTKVALAVPVLLLGSYFLRESGHPRRVAVSARELEVRLRSIRAYTDELGDEDRRHLLVALAEKVFLNTPETVSPVDATPNDSINLLETVKVISGAIRGK